MAVNGVMLLVPPLAALPAPPGDGFHLGPLFVHAYGLAYVVAIFAAVRLTERRWGRTGGHAGLVAEVALWGVPAGLLGGRLYVLATSWDQAGHECGAPLAVW